MIPKSAVDDRATITRLCARFPFRRLINISVLRLHGGLRSERDAVAGGIAHHRNPGLVQERNLDRDRVLLPGAGPNTGAVPDVSAVGLHSRSRRSGTWRSLLQARVERQAEATAQLALNRRHHRG